MNDYDYVFSIDNLNLVNDKSVDGEINKSENSLDMGGKQSANNKDFNKFRQLDGSGYMR